MSLVAIDPGLRKTGVAVFNGALLYRAAVVLNPAKTGPNDIVACLTMAAQVEQYVRLSLKELTALGHGEDPLIFVFEWPRVLDSSHQKGSKKSADPNDLLALNGVSCAVAARWPDCQHFTYRPNEWKGGAVDKTVMNERVWERLSVDEKARVERRPRGGLSHDTMDAIGIALHHQGRLVRKRAFA